MSYFVSLVQSFESFVVKRDQILYSFTDFRREHQRCTERSPIISMLCLIIQVIEANVSKIAKDGIIK
jgi:hypothetical protein